MGQMYRLDSRELDVVEPAPEPPTDVLLRAAETVHIPGFTTTHPLYEADASNPARFVFGGCLFARLARSLFIVHYSSLSHAYCVHVFKPSLPSFECTREFMFLCTVGRVRRQVRVSSSTACTSRCTRAATSRSPPTVSRASRCAPCSRRVARVRSGTSRPSRRARASTSPSSRQPSRLPSCFHGIRAHSH